METKPRTLLFLDVLAMLLLAFASWMVFFYAPEESIMGPVQRVFYFHVANGWLGMIGYLVAVIAAIAYLRTGNQKWDVVGVAAIEIGLVFMFVNIVSGSIWARPIWNTWWTWDPRLVTATIMELVYLAYLMLRQGIEDPGRRARFGAIYAIIGFASVPLTLFSIRIFRTIHPVVIGSSDPGAEGDFDMTPKMLQTFMFGLTAYTVIAISLLWNRIRLGVLADKIEQMKAKVVA